MRKLGINVGSFPGITPLEAMPYVKDAGFDAIFTGYRGDEVNAQFADEAARLGLSYDTIHAPFKGLMNKMWLPGEEGDASLELLKNCINCCSSNSIPVMIVHVSEGKHPPQINDIGSARFDALVDEAVKKGVKIAFENQRMIANLAFMFERYEKLTDNVGFCWDNGHEDCFTPGREYMPLFGSKLCALHLHDNMRQLDKDNHMLPFDGIINFHRVAELIRNSGYMGTLMLEALPVHTNLYDGWTPEQFYSTAHDRVARLRYMIEGE